MISPRVLPALLVLALGFGSLVMSANAQQEQNPRDMVYYDFPDWDVSKELPKDTFRFARLRYDSYYGYRGRGKWATDFPDSDLNFSYRLQELTSLEVDPDPIVVDIEAKQLANYPFIYMIEPGDIYITESEAVILREYMLNGGFIMVDDFWGTREWANFEQALRMIFPDREWEELTIEHPIFHCVFDLKEKPQVPSIGHALQGRSLGITYEWQKSGTENVHYRAIFDDEDRMMMIICFNTDLGDGWEREGENEWYFREFAEKKSFPMGINIVFYAMTH